MTRTNFLQFQPSVSPIPAQVTSKYFTVERAAKTLHRMSLVPLWAFPPKSPGTFDWERRVHPTTISGIPLYWKEITKQWTLCWTPATVYKGIAKSAHVSCFQISNAFGHQTFESSKVTCKHLKCSTPMGELRIQLRRQDVCTLIDSNVLLEVFCLTYFKVTAYSEEMKIWEETWCLNVLNLWYTRPIR